MNIFQLFSTPIFWGFFVILLVVFAFSGVMKDHRAGVILGVVITVWLGVVRIFPLWTVFVLLILIGFAFAFGIVEVILPRSAGGES